PRPKAETGVSPRGQESPSVRNPEVATVARIRTDQRFPVDLERFWNVRTGRASCSSLAPLLRKGGGLVDAPRQRASRGEGRIPLSPHLSSRRLTSGFVLLGERVHAMHLEVEGPVTAQWGAVRGSG